MEEEVKRNWHSNGQLSSETPYKNGMLHGLAKCWYSNGQLWYEIPLKNNIQCGAEIYFEY